jgi:hypothetical protein
MMVKIWRRDMARERRGSTPRRTAVFGRSVRNARPLADCEEAIIYADDADAAAAESAVVYYGRYRCWPLAGFTVSVVDRLGREGGASADFVPQLEKKIERRRTVYVERSFVRSFDEDDAVRGGVGWGELREDGAQMRVSRTDINWIDRSPQR